MPKIRVLVVDDSVVVRRLLTELLAGEADCEVVATAANGKIALARLAMVRPDVVTLDVEMPEMDGLQTLEAIRKTHPRLPIIMFSALTERAAGATLRALALGATDYVTKPVGATPAQAMEQVRAQLLPKIRGLVGAPPRSLAPPATAGWRKPVATRTAPIELVAIGASTGGPNALTALLAKLSGDFPVPIVITQHMPPVFTRLLAERIEQASSLKVHEAQGGEILAPGHVYIAPGDHHLVARRQGTSVYLGTHQAAPENSCRPSVDVMLRSLSTVYAGGLLAVILTGMGQDGMRGCEHVREAGGRVLAQDEASSVVWGMPGAVVKAGLADAVLPLDGMAAEITRRVRSSVRAGRAWPVAS